MDPTLAEQMRTLAGRIESRLCEEAGLEDLGQEWAEALRALAAAPELPPNHELRLAVIEGFREGLRAYAWWGDGVQYVGTCGTTLGKAVAALDGGGRFETDLIAAAMVRAKLGILDTQEASDA